jgi:flavin-binding monooxygenase-like protein
VIGAGSSGIAAAKCLLEEGHVPTVFEQTGRVGGNWVFREGDGHSSVYRSTFINTTRQLMAYSDFPMPEALPDYPHHTHIVEYFEAYVEQFRFRERIRFLTRVETVAPAPGGWDVTTRREGGSPETSRFDAVLVCNGHHWSPRWAEFPGQERFGGKILHSHFYKDPEGFEGQSVVVVGIGNSAVDISVELSRVAREVHLSTRRGAWVLPKYLFGRPLDHLGVNRFSKLIPLSIKSFVMRRLVNWVQGDLRVWGLPEPRFDLYQAHPTISSELLNRLGHGAIRVKPNIERFEPGVVRFEDGTSVRADSVVLCTGYEIRFPFLDGVLHVDENQIGLYKYVFHPDLPELGFIGLCQPLGALMPIAEMQSRWFARVLSGKCALPNAEVMRVDIARSQAAMRRRYVESPRHTIQVDFLEYMDEVARLIGVRPRLWRHPRLFRALMFGPATPAQFRLDGPGRWDGAADAILRACRRTTAAGESSGTSRPRVV